MINSEIPDESCLHENTEVSFGLAGGGYGAYVYCLDCGQILEKTQEELE